jgi:nitroreductase
METYDAIRTMLAVRQYRDRPIPDEVVCKIVEAGRLTGSSRNGQPWHFVVVRDRERLHQLGAHARTGPYTAQAAMAIVVAVDHQSPYGMSDGSRAIQSMMLAAWEEGVGSNWVGFNNLPEVGHLVGVPSGWDVIGLIPFGYPTKRLGKGKKNRKALAEVASAERWGHSFA